MKNDELRADSKFVEDEGWHKAAGNCKLKNPNHRKTYRQLMHLTATALAIS
jgi:hypothetical protein